MPQQTQSQYIEAIGRRKTATARVRIYSDSAFSFSINGKDLETYFPREEERATIHDAFTKSGIEGSFKVTVLVKGGGVSAQVEALRHGIARALTEYEPDSRQKLKKVGFLKRDPRRKERKKFGLKKARKAPQWSKR